MSFTFFDITVPIVLKNLSTVKNLLERGSADAKEKAMTEEAFLAQSLTPGMFDLKRQIQIVTDSAKGMVSRLTGVAPLVLEDTEETVAQLLERIDRTLAYLQTFTPEHFVTAAEAQIVLPFMPGQYQTGAEYVTNFALPNFFFHVTLVYTIIRVQGAPIGKADYIGGLNLHPLTQ